VGKTVYVAISLPAFVTVYLFYDSHSTGYDIITPLVLICISVFSSDAENLVLFGHLYLLWRNVYSNTLPIYLFIVELLRSLYVFLIQVHYQVYDFRIFSLMVGGVIFLHFCWVLCSTEFLI
jgi:hypothetical protein